MTVDSITTPTAVYNTLQAIGRKPSQSLGQHFLLDKPLLDSFVASLELSPDDWVVEIGPGLGHLTRSLLETGARVLAIEKDSALAETLAERLPRTEQLTVLCGDILGTGLKDLEAAGIRGEFVLTGNLPYYCSSEIIAKCYENWYGKWKRVGFLLQEEVVDRLVAGPGSKSYGRLSVLVQAFSTVRKVRRVRAHLFVPEPDVNSAWMVATPHPEPPNVTPSQMASMTRVCFAQRRKTLRNNLSREMGVKAVDGLLGKTGIDGGRRAEALDVAEFVELASYLRETNPGVSND